MPIFNAKKWTREVPSLRRIADRRVASHVVALSDFKELKVPIGADLLIRFGWGLTTAAYRFAVSFGGYSFVE